MLNAEHNTTAKDYISKSELQLKAQETEDTLIKAMDKYLSYWNVSSLMLMVANAVLKAENDMKNNIY